MVKKYKFLWVAIIGVIVSGCSNVSTPVLPEFEASQLDNNSMTNLTESDVKHLFNVTFSNHIETNGGSQYLKTAQSSPFLAVSGSNSSIVDARDSNHYSYTNGYYYDHPSAKIIEVKQGTCFAKSFYPTTGKTRIFESNCREFASLYRAPIAFEKQVESARGFVQNTFPVLLKNYNSNKPQADQCRQERLHETIAIQDTTGLIDKSFLKTLRPVIKTNALMTLSKLSQIQYQNFTCTSLKDMVIVDVPNSNSKYSFVYDAELPFKVEYASLPKNLSITGIRYNFLSGYETDDKVIKVSFQHKRGVFAYWAVEFTNMSNEFIDIQNSDFTFDGKQLIYIGSAKFPINIAPKSTKTIAMDGYIHPKLVKTMNDTLPITIAVKYKKGTKETTMFKNEAIRMEPLR